MSLDKVSQWTIHCDFCKRFNEEVITADSNVFTQLDAIKEFRIRGWKVSAVHKCPGCSDNLKTTEAEAYCTCGKKLNQETYKRECGEEYEKTEILNKANKIQKTKFKGGKNEKDV